MPHRITATAIRVQTAFSHEPFIGRSLCIGGPSGKPRIENPRLEQTAELIRLLFFWHPQRDAFDAFSLEIQEIFLYCQEKILSPGDGRRDGIFRGRFMGGNPEIVGAMIVRSST
jgi:hypothetical protein